MRLRNLAVAILLAISVAVTPGASAEERRCVSPGVMLREGEAVSAPEGYDQVVFYNTEDDKPIEIPPKLVDRNRIPVALVPNSSLMETAQGLKESSFKAPDKFMLLWEDSRAMTERCVQPFSVVFERPERVLLDATGIESRYVNPVKPVPIDGRPLQFLNNTGDRTFVVTIPFVYSAEEAASAYAVADYDRGRQVLADIVCKALGTDQAASCPRDALNELEGLRVLLEAVSRAKPAALETDCGGPLKSGSCIAELFFWTSMSEIDSAKLVSFARFNTDEANIRQILKSQAQEFVDELFYPRIDPSASPLSPAAFQNAKDWQAEVRKAIAPGDIAAIDAQFEKEAGVPSTEPESAAVPFSYEVKSAGLVARFGSSRIDLARRALTDAIRTKMGFPRVDEVKKDRLVARVMTRLGIGDRTEPGFPEKVQPLFKKLQERWKEISRESKKKKEDKIYYACQLREVEATAKLLASYSPNAGVPYSGVPESIRDDKLGDRVKCENFKGGDQPQMTQRFDALSEQGVEITNCQSTAAGTACSATATIPPYRRATFSRAILAHHPQPRIGFTVSFFGDTEIPGNPNGYVTRGDATAADEKPKSAFALQLGGDESASFDPDQTASGELRHSGATGALSFLYTGPVEASATIQFKSGDFGGSASQVQATQYQAKVYGPQRFVIQYGKIPFAKPSSGIAVNVFGEGIQFIRGQASLGYVVLRESAEGTATSENKDNALVLFQLKNYQLSWLQRQLSGKLDFLRTLDLVAVYGEDRKDSAVNPPVPRPFTYFSGGGEIRWGSTKFPAFGGSLAGYYSMRNVGSAADANDPMLPVADVVDGKGYVGLLRVSWSRLSVPDLANLQPEVRPAFGVSGLVGYGTGDDGSSPDEDKGYLGENAAFSNDVLFLSRIANSAAYSKTIGMGLSNKTYLGLQLTWYRSPLAWLAELAGVQKDIASRSSILTLHGYQFNHEIQGLEWAGQEADLQFNLEVPKNVQWVLGGAYYWTSAAVQKATGIKENLWSATAKLSIKLSNL